jgi:hypothetical protein
VSATSAVFSRATATRFHLLGERNELALERTPAGGEEHMVLLAIAVHLAALDVAELLHGIERGDRRRLHDAGLRAEAAAG